MSTEDHSYLITSPSALTRLINEITSSSMQTPIGRVEVHPLAPLRTEAMLANGLNHVDSFRCNSYGPTTTRKDAVQVLSLTPLFAAWRAVWSIFPVDVVGEFAFNIELSPWSAEGTCAESPIHWTRCVPEIGGLAVPEGRVNQSILGLATVMRVRSSKPVFLSLIGAEEYRRMHAHEIPKAETSSKA